MTFQLRITLNRPRTTPELARVQLLTAEVRGSPYRGPGTFLANESSTSPTNAAPS